MRLLLISLAVLGATLLGPVHALEAQSRDVVVILNRKNETTELTRFELSKIYKGTRRSWDRELEISLYLPPRTSHAIDTVAEEILKVGSADGIARFYLQAIFRNIFRDMPMAFATTNETVRRVAVEPGAIAIVDRREISNPRLVKIIRVTDLAGR